MLVTCLSCRSPLEIPFEREGFLLVVCGVCGVSFQASVGLPVQTAVATALPSVETRPRAEPSVAGIVLALAAGLTAGASLLSLTPLAIAGCGLFLAPIIMGIAVLPELRGRTAFPIALVAVILVGVAPVLLALGSLASVGLGFGSSVVFAAAFVEVRAKRATAKLAIGASLAILAGVLPFASPVALLFGPGLLIAAGALVATFARTAKPEDAKTRDALVAAGFVAALGGITYARWILASEWEPVHVGSMALLGGSVYGVAAFARPLAAKVRAELAAALGAFLLGLAGYVAVAHALSGWPADYAPYFLVLGAGAIYLGGRIHKPESVWPLACLGAGAFVVAASAVTLLTRWPSLTTFAVAALVAWSVVGLTLAWTRFAGSRASRHALALRAGTIAAFGGVLVAAGAHMLYAGRGIEGIVELALGTPLVGFAILRSGAPWVPRLAVSGLFLTTVFASWLALVA